MPHEIVMPRLGWSTEEGTLIEWLKKNGDPVRSGDVVCVIESDKAQVEVESFDAGVLRIPADSPAPGVKVPVGTLLGYVLAPGEALPPPGMRSGPPPSPAPASTVGGAPREVALPPRRVGPRARTAPGRPRARGLAGPPRSSTWSGQPCGEAAGRDASSSATSAPRAPPGRAPCVSSSPSG